MKHAIKHAIWLSTFLSTIVFAKSADQVMVMPHTGNVATWGKVDLTKNAAVTGESAGACYATGTTSGLSFGTLGIGNGGTGQTSFASGAMSSNGSALTSGTLSVGNGGTGATSFTSGNLITGNGSSPLSAISQLTSKSFLPSVGQQISSSSGSFSTTSGSLVDVTNLSVTITTTGRPVLMALIPDGSSSYSSICAIGRAAIADMIADIDLDRGGSAIAHFQITIVASTGSATFQSCVPPSSVIYLDPVSAGTYTYKIQIKGSDSTAPSEIDVSNVKLIAFEL